MDAWQAINTVRVVRHFADRPMPAEHVDRIVNAGRRAGSSKNQQSWAFIVVRDRDHLRQLATVGRYAGHVAGATVAVALVTPDEKGPANNSIMWDLGRAAQNMVLATTWRRNCSACRPASGATSCSRSGTRWTPQFSPLPIAREGAGLSRQCFTRSAGRRCSKRPRRIAAASVLGFPPANERGAPPAFSLEIDLNPGG